MYGGEDRAADPALRDADAKLVADAIKAFGSSRAASDAFVSDGDAAFRSGDLASAMRFYNQAWLVDKDNPTSTGASRPCSTSATSTARARACSTPARRAGRCRPGCGRSGRWCTPAAGSPWPSSATPIRSRYFARAEELLKQAEADPNASRSTVIDAWARYYYGRGDYTAAWAKVAEYRRVVGKEMDPAFLASLRDKQPEPVPAAAAPAAN